MKPSFWGETFFQNALKIFLLALWSCSRYAWQRTFVMLSSIRIVRIVPHTQNFLFTFDQKIEKLSGLIIFSHNLLSQSIKTLNYLIFYFLIKISPIFVRWWVSGCYLDAQNFTFTFFWKMTIKARGYARHGSEGFPSCLKMFLKSFVIT